MVTYLLEKSEYSVLKWYATLHLHQQRILKLYKDGGVTKDIADRELRLIYYKMKLSRKLDNYLMSLRAKAQSFAL